MVNCTLLLIRHGVTQWNREGRYQGHADPPLSRDGRAQALRLSRSLRHFELDAIYSSDLARARETAAPLALCRNLAVTPDPRLRELDFGRWDGRTVDELMALQPDALQAWWADPVTVAPPGGETVPALWARVGEALGEIAGAHPGGTVAIITHGGPIRLALTRLLTGELHPPPAVSVPNGGWLLIPSSQCGMLIPLLRGRQALPTTARAAGNSHDLHESGGESSQMSDDPPVGTGQKDGFAP